MPWQLAYHSSDYHCASFQRDNVALLCSSFLKASEILKYRVQWDKH